MGFGNRQAVTYDVGFNVNLGSFRAQLGEAENIYQRTTGKMSTEALRLSVAEEKVARAVSRSGPVSLQARAATAALRREQESLARQASVTSTKLLAEERTLGRLTRGAIAGSGAFSGLGRTLAFSSAAFLGASGFVFAVRSSINAAKEHEVVEGQLQAALKASGIEYDQYKGHIQDALRAQELLTGFTEEKTTRAFTALVRATGSVDGGLRALHVAGNIARGANIDLETATLKVVRAFNGQTRGLTALGLVIPKGVKGWQALEIAQNKYAGSSAAYAKTAQGAQDRFNIALHQTEVLVGEALLPVLTKYLTKGADWLGQTKNQKKIQEDVNAAVHTAAGLVHDLEGAFHDAESVLKPVVKSLGGVRDTVKILIALKFAAIVRGWATSFGTIEARAATAFAGVTASAAAMTGKLETDAVAIDRALTTATRPREIVITESVVGGVGLPGFGSAGRGVRPGGVAGRINQYVRNPQTPAGRAPGIPGTGGLAGLVIAGLAFGESGEQGSVEVAWDQKADQYYAISVLGSSRVRHRISMGEARKISSAFVDKIEAFKRAQKTQAVASPYVAGAAHRPLSTVTPPVPRLDRGSQIDLNLSRAQASGNQNAIVAALKAKADFDLRYIKIQEGLLKTDVTHRKQHAATLQRLYGDLDSVQGQIQSINDQAASKKAESDRKAAAAQKAADKAAGAAAKTIVDEYNRVVKEGGKQAALTQKTQEQKLRNAITAGELAVKNATKGTAAYDKAVALEKKALQAEIRYYAQLAVSAKTSLEKQKDLAAKLSAQKQLAGLGKTKAGAASDFRAQRDEFLTAFTNIVGEFAPNVTGRPPIIINQNFPHPPTKDGHREARVARVSAQAAFDG